MYPDYNDIVKNIKEIMEEQGIMQQKIANRAGFTEQEFSNMMNKRRKLIRVEHIPRIAKALGVEPNEIYGIKTDET